MNRRFDLAGLPRCGAKARTTGQPCKRPGTLKNGRCRLHGGRSTGPKTTQGLRRARKGNWKHGYESSPARKTERYVRLAIRIAKAECLGLRSYVPVLARDRRRLVEAVEQAARLGRELEGLRRGG